MKFAIKQLKTKEQFLQMQEISLRRQSLSHSCLAVCLLMLREQSAGEFSAKDEKKITLAGMSRKYQYYVVGVPFEFSKQTNTNVTVVVDNKIFANELTNAFAGSKVNVTQHEITIELIRQLTENQPVICHIDDNYIGDYSHASHFIIIEKLTVNKATIIDPMDGKRKTTRIKTLEDSIYSLKTRIKMCPLLYYLE